MKRAFTILIAFAAVHALIACQPGEKKEAPAAGVYEAGVEASKKLTAALENYGVQLRGAAPESDGVEPALPAELTRTEDRDEVQSLLEKYILTAKKLLDLGDDTVVYFPEKGEIRTGLMRASKYLGHLYAFKAWINEASPVQTADVDWSEYGDRLRKVSSLMKRLKGLGIDILRPLTFKEQTQKMKSAELQELAPLAEDAGRDSLRMRVLSQRNDGWNMAGSDVIEHGMPQFFVMFGAFREGIRDELDRRKKANEP